LAIEAEGRSRSCSLWRGFWFHLVFGAGGFIDFEEQAPQGLQWRHSFEGNAKGH